MLYAARVYPSNDHLLHYLVHTRTITHPYTSIYILRILHNMLIVNPNRCCDPCAHAQQIHSETAIYTQKLTHKHTIAHRRIYPNRKYINACVLAPHGADIFCYMRQKCPIADRLCKVAYRVQTYTLTHTHWIYDRRMRSVALIFTA